MAVKSPLFKQRRAGVLLHPTSLPCSESCWGDNKDDAFGTLGKDAYHFVDLVAHAGLSIWQMLPTGPTQKDMSPYQSISAHAGNPDLISLDWLRERGWIKPEDVQQVGEHSLSYARQQGAVSFFQFLQTPEGEETRCQFENFCSQQNYWLDDFSLFSALRTHFKNASWITWPEELRKRNPDAIQKVRIDHKQAIHVVLFEQFCFFSQWEALKNYANQKGIYLFGDMPIFVGHDSADVWAQPHYFQLDEEGKSRTVAGVPPDYFSETGQHWGNPHYDWAAMEADGFQWWLARLRTQLHLFDLIRIDHFRGFEAFWEIPGDTQDARTGKWVKAPGEAFLHACHQTYPELPLVAENLGLITKEVEALRKQFHLPGMLVLQFAFDGNTDNPHLPHNHSENNVIYSGTHDNDTTLGWYESLEQKHRDQLSSYCFNSPDKQPWLLIELALSSVGRMAIIPMQDFLELDGRHRMNMPGTTDRNWVWKFSWDQVETTLAERIRRLLKTYHRLS
jgi:4-alpha-glucanotransferase